jgi:hypothetical protein
MSIRTLRSRRHSSFSHTKEAEAFFFKTHWANANFYKGAHQVEDRLGLARSHVSWPHGREHGRAGSAPQSREHCEDVFDSLACGAGPSVGHRGRGGAVVQKAHQAAQQHARAKLAVPSGAPSTKK